MVCRDCGCTDDRACATPSGLVCWWVGPDRCSFCAYGHRPEFKLFVRPIDTVTTGGLL